MNERLRQQLFDPFAMALAVVGVTVALIVAMGESLLALFQPGDTKDRLDRPELWYALVLSLSVIGVAGFLVPPFFYFRNSAEALGAYYGEVAKATDREVMVYDNPNATKTPMSVDVLARLAEDNPNINHIKVTDTDIAKVSALAERTDAVLLAGSDEVMHHQVLRGCAGAVTAAPHVFPRVARAWFDAAGDEAEGRRHYDRMTPFIIELLQGSDQYPAAVKLALHHLGVLPDAAVLPPLTPLDARRRQGIAVVLDGHDLD